MEMAAEKTFLARFCIFPSCSLASCRHGGSAGPRGRQARIHAAEWELSLFNVPDRSPAWNRRSVCPSATGHFTPLFHSFTLSSERIKINRALELQKFARRRRFPRCISAVGLIPGPGHIKPLCCSTSNKGCSQSECQYGCV